MPCGTPLIPDQQEYQWVRRSSDTFSRIRQRPRTRFRIPELPIRNKSHWWPVGIAPARAIPVQVLPHSRCLHRAGSGSTAGTPVTRSVPASFERSPMNLTDTTGYCRSVATLAGGSVSAPGRGCLVQIQSQFCESESGPTRLLRLPRQLRQHATARRSRRRLAEEGQLSLRHGSRRQLIHPQ